MDWILKLKHMIKEEEQYRQFAYPDPLSALAKKYPAHTYGWGRRSATQILIGIDAKAEDGAPWTVGYGYTHGVLPSTEFSEGMADHKLEEVIQQSVLEVASIVPSFKEQPDAVKAVLVDMCYNMGIKTLRQFKTTLKAFNDKNYEAAATGMEHSLWYKQVGNRAKKLVRMVRTHKFEE